MPYVEYGGTQMLQPPYVAQNVSLYAFVVPADMGAMQKVLDRRLNLPSGGAVQFEPAGPFLLIAFNKLGKMYSMNRPDRDKGWFSEQECAVWMRVVDRKRQLSMWFHPYIFVDNSYALVLGRELYGFPKALGWFDMPDDPKQATAMWMETLALPTFSPNTQGVRTRLISATKIAGLDEPLKVVESAVELLAEAAGVLAADDGLLGRLELVEHSLSDLFQRKEPMVFLKQFPTPDTPGTACYQSIVEMTAQATAFHGGCLVPGEWRIDIAAAASHPVAAELGLSGNSIKAALAVWVGFDMNVNLGTNLWVGSASGDTTPGKKEKIAILGGGVGAMATALQLTSKPDWQSKYDITVYQKGWRLGGKGASGRGECDRIEEHGLHIWMGFYENAFRLMRQVYEENKQNRVAGSPLQDWTEAFKPHDFLAVMDRAEPGADSKWDLWPVHFPNSPGLPGDGQRVTLWDTFVKMLGFIKEIYQDSQFHQHGGHTVGYSGVLGEIQHIFGPMFPTILNVVDLALVANIEIAGQIARELDPDPRRHLPGVHEALAKLMEYFRNSVRNLIRVNVAAGDVASRRLFEIIDLAVCVGGGLLRGGYFQNPAMLDTLEDDLQVWLKDQGADPITYDVKQSAVMRGLYDLVFAYENGDTSKPSFEAGPAIRSILLIVGAYKGSIFWKMQAGMGDVVFGPMYQVLKARGVKFEFFHRVDSIKLNAGGTAVDTIEMAVQATLKDASKGYDPLVVCGGLPSWPSAPRYEQLVEGEEIKAGGYELQSFWTTWKNPAVKTMRAGTDFDQVVLAISIGAFPYIFDDVKALPARFQQMISNVQTVRTQAMQLWVNQPLEKLGWTLGSVVLDAYTDPINTWAVMDQLLVRENWPNGSVQGIHYFCGHMAGGIPPQSDAEAPRRELAAVKATCDEFVENDLAELWPNVKGEDCKIVSRFYRCNLDPSERYVMSVAGSTKYRLRANESGVNKLVFAGDWTHNGFNAGCVEAAVMSGIQAANAIEGKPLNEGIDGPLVSQLEHAAGAQA